MKARAFRSLVLAMGLLALVVAPSVAHAQEAPVPTLTSANASAGGGDDVSGAGCAARVSVQIQFDGVVLETTRSTVTGRYRAHLIVPVSAVPGSHRVTVVCAGASGQVTTATTVSVPLPRTGANTFPLIAIALTLILTGASLQGVRPRRHVYLAT